MLSLDNYDQLRTACSDNHFLGETPTLLPLTRVGLTKGAPSTGPGKKGSFDTSGFLLMSMFFFVHIVLCAFEY